MTIKERYTGVLSWFEKNNPLPETELHYEDPYELIVAVILSAQCTDVRVNMITPGFFNVFPDAESLAEAETGQVYELIKSCSYPNNKTKNLIGMAKTLLDVFDGVMPSDVEDLQQLPGVGRKTANVIASVLFQKPDSFEAFLQASSDLFHFQESQSDIACQTYSPALRFQ
jgi:endonuclease-3